MQTAQRIISDYRRRRVIVCAVLAILVLIVTLSVRYTTERNLNEQRVAQFNQRVINTLDTLLAPLNTVSDDIMQLIGTSCADAQLKIREHAAKMQTVRAIGLIQDGVLYCSSIYGSRDVGIHQLHTRLPSPDPLLFLSRDSSLLKGTPVLIFWRPQPGETRDGVMQIINIQMLTSLLLKPEHPWVTRAVLNVGNDHLEYGSGLQAKIVPDEDQVSQQTASKLYPYSITAIGPSADQLTLQNLPSQLPLALLLSMLVGYIAWLATANRMSFSWEINLGLAAREFEVFCQPLVSARNLECVGVELLLRWNNPRQGWISPEVFIPLAEQQQQIAPLTRFVLDETVRHLEIFPKTPGFHIGLNVAASHFHDGAIIRDLKRYWFPATPKQKLTLELTERNALPAMDHSVVQELHRLGIDLAIDDFGTGHSSLAYLETLNPNVLKIDKSFTAAIGTDAVNSTVTDIIIALGQRLDIDLVAEGVETQEQAEYLRRNGVAVLQGFLYAKPMPLRDFAHWLEGNIPPPPRHEDRAIPVFPAR
jgi:sensor c-di-GMP phosphodiesterase-like protein